MIGHLKIKVGLGSKYYKLEQLPYSTLVPEVKSPLLIPLLELRFKYTIEGVCKILLPLLSSGKQNLANCLNCILLMYKI